MACITSLQVPFPQKIQDRVSRRTSCILETYFLFLSNASLMEYLVLFPILHFLFVRVPHVEEG